MKLSDDDGKILMNTVAKTRDLEAELDAIDHENDPDAMSKHAEIVDSLITLSMGTGSLRRQLAKSEKPKTNDAVIKPQKEKDA